MAHDSVNPAAASVRSRRSARTVEPADEAGEPQTPTRGIAGESSTSGVSHRSLSGSPLVVGSFTTTGIDDNPATDYVTTTAPAYHCFYPRGARQPSTVLLWNAGQRVRADHYRAHGGAGAPARAADARPTNTPGGGLTMPPPR